MPSLPEAISLLSKWKFCTDDEVFCPTCTDENMTCKVVGMGTFLCFNFLLCVHLDLYWFLPKCFGKFYKVPKLSGSEPRKWLLRGARHETPIQRHHVHWVCTSWTPHSDNSPETEYRNSARICLFNFKYRYPYQWYNLYYNINVANYELTNFLLAQKSKIYT